MHRHVEALAARMACWRTKGFFLSRIVLLQTILAKFDYDKCVAFITDLQRNSILKYFSFICKINLDRLLDVTHPVYEVVRPTFPWIIFMKNKVSSISWTARKLSYFKKTSHPIWCPSLTKWSVLAWSRWRRHGLGFWVRQPGVGNGDALRRDGRLFNRPTRLIAYLISCTAWHEYCCSFSRINKLGQDMQALTKSFILIASVESGPFARWQHQLSCYQLSC